jgi:hypothetical protein
MDRQIRSNGARLRWEMEAPCGWAELAAQAHVEASCARLFPHRLWWATSRPGRKASAPPRQRLKAELGQTRVGPNKAEPYGRPGRFGLTFFQRILIILFFPGISEQKKKSVKIVKKIQKN